MEFALAYVAQKTRQYHNRMQSYEIQRRRQMTVHTWMKQRDKNTNKYKLGRVSSSSVFFPFQLFLQSNIYAYSCRKEALEENDNR